MNEEELRQQYASQYPPPQRPNSAHPTEWKNYMDSYQQWTNNFAQWKQETALQGKIDQRYKDVTDFNSPLYQQYRGYIQKSTPGIGTDTLLAPLKAQGFSGTSAKNIAQNQAKNLQTGRNEQISNAVTEFAIGQQSQATGLLGIYSSNQNNYNQLILQQAQLQEQKRQYNETQSGNFVNSLLSLGGGLLANFIPGIGSVGKATTGAGSGSNSPYTPNYNPSPNRSGGYDPYGQY